MPLVLLVFRSLLFRVIRDSLFVFVVDLDSKEFLDALRRPHLDGIPGVPATLLAFARGGDQELRREPGGEGLGGQADVTADKSVRGLDDQAGVAHADQHHQPESARLVADPPLPPFGRGGGGGCRRTEHLIGRAGRIRAQEDRPCPQRLHRIFALEVVEPDAIRQRQAVHRPPILRVQPQVVVLIVFGRRRRAPERHLVRRRQPARRGDVAVGVDRRLEPIRLGRALEVRCPEDVADGLVESDFD